MIDRTFNQEERRTLTQDKRLVLVDPGRTREDPPAARRSAVLDPASSPLQTASWKTSAVG